MRWYNPPSSSTLGLLAIMSELYHKLSYIAESQA
jgi:hypothetical protein